MYILNHNPNKKLTCQIMLEPFGKFWQLVSLGGGVVAESNSHRRLYQYAQSKKLSVKNYLY